MTTPNPEPVELECPERGESWEPEQPSLHPYVAPADDETPS